MVVPARRIYHFRRPSRFVTPPHHHRHHPIPPFYQFGRLSALVGFTILLDLALPGRVRIETFIASAPNGFTVLPFSDFAILSHSPDWPLLVFGSISGPVGFRSSVLVIVRFFLLYDFAWPALPLIALVVFIHYPIVSIFGTAGSNTLLVGGLPLLLRYIRL